MSRFLKSTIALSAALLLTIFGATIQGRYAYRWAIPTALPSAVHQLSTIPHNFQDCKCVYTLKFKEETIRLLQCSGYINYIFENTKTGQLVNLAIIVGPSGPTSVHTPEICFSTKNYDIQSPRTQFHIRNKDEFWNVNFRSLDPGMGLLTVVYAWFGSNSWVATENPRITLNKYPFLYKLQIASQLTASKDHHRENHCKEFLTDFLPIFDKTIINPTQNIPSEKIISR